ncbi:SYF2-domain-containing protein [Anaeromyces robustus]|uniref:Pre-mRNA-splicing factor SYF2 n=1 Tax=Anaeromyces robustus TaxID=1754192 RepID=A0A1Y1XAA0_9FUNG|nr:SYF2-domain-containing protein [Anaeromyces robustus]|eukprot:ORX82274.1 SYF2-domain-containing protein [Anaeromyces robustus]
MSDKESDDNKEITGSKKLSQKERRLERLKKFKKLQERLDDSINENRKDVYEEHSKSKENPKEEARQERKRRKAEILLDKKLAEENDIDYERKRALEYTIEDVERWEKKQKKKAKRADTGFTDYAQIAAKKYKKQINEFKPNLQEYNKQKQMALLSSLNTGDTSDFYRDANSTAYASIDSKPSTEAVNRLVKDLEKQVERRNKFSRRRRWDDDAEVTYINERNMRFNKKLSRAYDKYTEEIKANLERGTAL